MLTEETRNKDTFGATFIYKNPVSIGHFGWHVTSSIRFDTLEEMVDLLRSHQEELELHLKNLTLNKYLILFDDLEDALKQNTGLLKGLEDTLKQISYLGFGSDIRQKQKQKRFVELLLPFATSLLKLGTSYLGNRRFEDRLQTLRDRVDIRFEDIENVTENLMNFQDEQYSVNLKVYKEISTLTGRVNKLEQNLATNEKKVEQAIVYFHLQGKIQKLARIITSTTALFEQIEAAIYDGMRGNPTSPFFDPETLVAVYHEFHKTEGDHSSFFKEDDMLSLMSLATAKIYPVERVIYCITTVRIPTIQTTASLYNIRTFPFWNEESQRYIEWKPEHELIAVNKRSEYILLNVGDLSSCEQFNSITLCDQHDVIFTHREERSCETEVFFQNVEHALGLCTFETHDLEQVPKPVHLEDGIYHVAVNEETNVEVACNNGERYTERIDEFNGHITLNTKCSATVGVHTIEYFNSPKNVTHEILYPDVAKVNFTDIIGQKKKYIENELAGYKIEEISNEDIIEDLEDQTEDEERLEEFKREGDKNLERLLENQRILLNKTRAKIEMKNKNKFENYGRQLEDARKSIFVLQLTLSGLFGFFGLVVVCTFGYICKVKLLKSLSEKKEMIDLSRVV